MPHAEGRHRPPNLRIGTEGTAYGGTGGQEEMGVKEGFPAMAFSRQPVAQ
jgi:hypothetical protein